KTGGDQNNGNAERESQDKMQIENPLAAPKPSGQQRFKVGTRGYQGASRRAGPGEGSRSQDRVGDLAFIPRPAVDKKIGCQAGLVEQGGGGLESREDQVGLPQGSVGAKDAHHPG